MEKLTSQFRTINENLGFERDQDGENNFPTRRDDYLTMTAFRKLEGNNRAVSIAFYWDGEGKFFDLWVSPRRGTPNEYKTYTVIHEITVTPYDNRKQ